jgi:large-conductance mechanosensitive channel
LSSDGGSSLLFDGSDNVKPGFLVPILGFAIDEPQNASKFLTTTISDPKANQLTSDDKTIVVAYRKNKKLSSEKIIYKEVAPLTKNEKSTTKANVENVAFANPSKNSRATTPESKIINKKTPDKFYKYKLFAKYLTGFFIISLVLFLLIYVYQWNEANDVKNITAKKEEANISKEFKQTDITSSTQPASNAASVNLENGKESPTEALKNQANAMDINLDKEKPKTASGPLDKASSK